MKKNKTNIFTHIFFIAFCLACFLPFILLLMISLSNEQDIWMYGYTFFPRQIDFTAYRFIFTEPSQLLNAYRITILSTVIGTFLSVLIMSMAAFSLSKKAFKFRSFFTFMLFFTMLFNGGLVPTFILITNYLRLENNFWVYVIPGLVNVFHIIVLRTFFQSIPEELFESARMDGANEFYMFFKILLPLCKPALATIALLGALGRWNEWFAALLFITDPDLVTLQYLLQRILMNVEILRQHANSPAAQLLQGMPLPGETLTMAMAILVAGPMVLVFPFFQKYFVEGLTVGSVKG